MIGDFMNVRRCIDWNMNKKEFESTLKHGHKFRYSADYAYSDVALQYKTHWNNRYDLFCFIRTMISI